MNKFTLASLALRALCALALVLLTFNPTGHSYAHMLRENFPEITPLEAVFGLLLLIGWLVYLGATLRAIGLLGMALVAALFAALVWLVVSWGWLSFQDESALTWIGLVVLALILTIGLSWSHLYQRWTGQATVDEVEER